MTNIENYSKSEAVEAIGVPRPELAGAIQGAINRFHEAGHELDFQQEEALTAIGLALLDGEDTGYVEMATSSGKTIVEAILADAGVAAGLRVLALSSKKTIADQIAGLDGTEGIGGFTSLRDRVEVREHYGTKRGNKTARVVTSTYAGFLNDFKNGHAKLGRFDLVIADENHRSLGPQISQAMSEAFPGAVKLGFSATPDYGVNRTSDETYGRRLYEFSLSSAIESGKTAPVRALVYETDQSIKLVDHVGDYTEKELAPLIMNSDRNAAVLRFVEDFVASGRRGFVACLPGSNNLHARIMRDLIAQMPTKSGKSIRVADIGSHISDDEVRDRLQAIKDDELDVIAATRGLDEGVNVPPFKFGINTVPSTSPVRIKQLFGRLLRHDGQNTEGIFVDFVDRKTGIAKGQYTALHALGLLDFDMTRVIGEGRPAPQSTRYVESHYEFGPEIYAMLQKSQGKTLQDIVMPRNTPSVFDTLRAQWNRTLADEGLPEELPYNLVLDDRLVVRVEAARMALRESLRREPSIGEVQDEIATTRDRTAAIGEYGIRLAWNDVSEEIDAIVENDSEDPSFDVMVDVRLWDQVAAVLNTLTEREASVVKMRFGLTVDGPKTLDEIGLVYGVLRERIRQVESKALSKLRHPKRANVLRDYIYGTTPGETLVDNWYEAIENPETIQDSYHNYTLALGRQLIAYAAEHSVDGLRALVESHDYDKMFDLVDVAGSVKMSKNMSGFSINVVDAARPYLQLRLDRAGVDNNPYLTGIAREDSYRKMIWQLGLRLLDELEQNRGRHENKSYVSYS